MKNDPSIDEWLKQRLQEAVDLFAAGSADKFGQLIGYANGGYIREVLKGIKPVRAAIIDRTRNSDIPQLKEWFSSVPDMTSGGLGATSNVEPGPESRGTVPLISWIAAGSWNGAHDPLQPGEAERWLDCPVNHSERTFALRVRGDSMTAPYGRSYPEGCIIFVDPQKKSPVNGQRIIAKLAGEDEVTFKVFKQEDGRIWLQPLNPMHKPIEDKFKVLGTVIGKWEDE